MKASTLLESLKAIYDEPTAAAIAAVRNRLLGEHLGAAPEEVRAAIDSEGSLIGAINKLEVKAGRSLRSLAEPESSSDTLVELAGIADPERPVSLESLVGEFAPRPATTEPTQGAERGRSGPAWKMTGSTL